MNSIPCQSVLLDIEGTVSPVAFVYDVMFPYARNHVDKFLKEHWEREDVQQTIGLVRQDVIQVFGADAADHFPSSADSANLDVAVDSVALAVHKLMDQDAKVTGLKQLQGMVWKQGFQSGQLVAELFADVLPQLQQWKSQGLSLWIYSSGSIAAQKLFFGHTTQGNLLELFNGHFDTTTGPKKETASYSAIASQMNLEPQQICFVSDIVAELDAAANAGMATVFRPADTSQSANKHPQIDSFADLSFVKK